MSEQEETVDMLLKAKEALQEWSWRAAVQTVLVQIDQKLWRLIQIQNEMLDIFKRMDMQVNKELKEQDASTSAYG